MLVKVYVCVHAQSFSGIQLLAILWTIALGAPQSMGFSKQDCWSGLSFPSAGLFF